LTPLDTPLDTPSNQEKPGRCSFCGLTQGKWQVVVLLQRLRTALSNNNGFRCSCSPCVQHGGLRLATGKVPACHRGVRPVQPNKLNIETAPALYWINLYIIK
jgi:hypothetical protein